MICNNIGNDLDSDFVIFSEFIAQTAKQTGILLDNCYTSKAAYGLQQLLLNKPEVFKGRRILFIHSG